MKFLMLCCFEESRWEGLPAAQRDKIMEEYGNWVKALKERGQLLGGAKLDRCSTAVSVCEKNGKPLAIDGPFAETKEQLGGYHVIECNDRAEAVAIAQRIPTLPAGGRVEVRPISWTE